MAARFVQSLVRSAVDWLPLRRQRRRRNEQSQVGYYTYTEEKEITLVSCVSARIFQLLKYLHPYAVQKMQKCESFCALC